MGADQALSDQSFCSFLNRRMEKLMELAVYVNRSSAGDSCFTRPLLADLLSEATKIEELLDAYGAKHNRRWHPLRKVIAAIKLFSNVSYKLQHILHFLPEYRLLAIERDFPAATKRALQFICSILVASLGALIRKVGELGIRVPGETLSKEIFADELLTGHLTSNRPNQKVASPEETVVHLATAFLNLAEDSKFIHDIGSGKVELYADWIPEPISEERLRNLEEMFHNLQSLYDTHISDSNVENLDRHLPVLRGHITVIYHLLETATSLVHYYERHIDGSTVKPGKSGSSLVDPSRLLDVLMNYSLCFASSYITRTRSLCHEMLRRYAVQGSITVTAPRYRGFHVRPSTLVAKIVNHYGSEVRMSLNGETYNAGVALDLFRANEKINAKKKRWLAGEISSLGLHLRGGRMFLFQSDQPGPPDKDFDQDEIERLLPRLAHDSLRSLFSQNKLVLYDRNLPLEDIKPLKDETAAEYVTRVLVQLFTTGKIDVIMDIEVTFTGDRRVLADINLLAENGYGEDDFGNNLPLPEKLSYLRK